MTITTTLLALGSTPVLAGTVIGTQAIAAPSTWTRLTTLGTIPPSGAKVRASSDAEPFRIWIKDPVESTNPAGPTPPPANNGVLIPWPTGQAFEQLVPNNAQVWVKQA